MKNDAVPALMFPASALRLSWMRCWISPKNHSLCNCNCHSFSLPIKRFSSPTGLVLQDSGCLHFKNSPFFIFKRRKGKKGTKVLSAFQASRTVVRSKSRAIQNLDSPCSCMENAVGGSNTRTWKNCWFALTRKPIPCWFQRSSKDARVSLSIVFLSHFVMTNKTIPQSNKSCVLQIQNSWSERENRKRATSRARQVVHSQANFHWPLSTRHFETDAIWISLVVRV